MDNMLSLIRELQFSDLKLPFSIYQSQCEQKILDIPIAKPMCIFVVAGEKQFGEGFKLSCRKNQFIFFSEHSSVHIRNIPNEGEYVAILIEFDYLDFDMLPRENSINKTDYFIGDVDGEIAMCLKQFFEIATCSLADVCSLRRKELLLFLYHSGYRQVASLIGRPTIKRKVHDMLISNKFREISMEKICAELAMSESTLRRKLQLENTTMKQIKNSARLGFGLHLLQTTAKPIGLVSEECGYQSQSRFTVGFKNRFGLTPSELRKTKQLSQ